MGESFVDIRITVNGDAPAFVFLQGRFVEIRLFSIQGSSSTQSTVDFEDSTL